MDREAGIRRRLPLQPPDNGTNEVGIQRQSSSSSSSSSSRGIEGLDLCLDYSILSFRKPLPVIEFLKEYLPGFKGIHDVKRLRSEINTALQGLRVMTSLMRRQMHTIAGLTREDVIDIYFELVDREGKAPPRRTSLVEFYKEKWNKDILYQNIPCLELGTPQRSNRVSMEFCVLVEKQRYIPKEGLDKNSALFLRKLSVSESHPRHHEPLGHLTLTIFPKFKYAFLCLQIHKSSSVEITKVVAQAIQPPPPPPTTTTTTTTTTAAKFIDHWAVVDFTCYNEKQIDDLIESLRGSCKDMGMKIAEPRVYRFKRMQQESSFVNEVEDFLKSVTEEYSNEGKKTKLEMIVCLMMTEKRTSIEYKYLKWVSETRIGVPTQCLSAPQVLNKGINHYLVSVCRKIKAKLWGIRDYDFDLRHFHDDDDDDVMFIGVHVNHPSPHNKSSPSIAAVVGTLNWPAANRYAARVSPQPHRSETISRFGAMCEELIMAYARRNNMVKPRRIVVFRSGGEGEMESVVSAELLDLKKRIYDGGTGRPTITVIATQQRHPTLHLVDAASTTAAAVNTAEYGAGSPTHYNVLWDENSFAADELLKLVHGLCSRCSSSVWLVPPLYYARCASRRGRLFQELAAEIDSSPAKSFDPSFYSVHTHLDGTMFFI